MRDDESDRGFLTINCLSRILRRNVIPPAKNSSSVVIRFGQLELVLMGSPTDPGGWFVEEPECEGFGIESKSSSSDSARLVKRARVWA